MAGEAVPFGVTRHARFEILAGGLTVANNERLFRVMIPGPQGAISGESCRNMTGRTERSGIVTIAARRFTRVRRGRVGHKESLTVIPSSRIAGRWAMTVQAVLSGVTPSTRGGDSGRIRTVQVPKAKVVGSGGRVIGVDMTPEMLIRGIQNAPRVAQRLGYHNVEFRYGYLEEIPVDTEFADLVTSNCVVNLSPDKQKVFGEIYRIIKSGGRFVISDIVSEAEVPSSMREDKTLCLIYSETFLYSS